MICETGDSTCDCIVCDARRLMSKIVASEMDHRLALMILNAAMQEALAVAAANAETPPTTH